MTERDADNRRLAEFVGSDHKAGHCLICGGDLVGLHWWEHCEPPNFFKDPAASWLLLKKMPEPNLWLESSKGEPVLWGCEADMDGPGGLAAFDADPQVAIALAALKLIDSQEGK